MTPDQREGVSRADTRQQADTEEVLGAETPIRSVMTHKEPNHFSSTDERDQSRVRGRSPRTQKSPAPCEFTNRVQDTAFWEEGGDGKRRRKS